MNWENPLAQGLKFAAYPVNGEPYDAVTGLTATLTTAGSLVVRNSVDGNYADAQGQNGVYAFAVNKCGLDSVVGPCSMFAEASIYVNGSASMVRSRSPSTGDAMGIGFDDAIILTNSVFGYTANNTFSGSASDSLGLNSELYNHRAMVTLDGTNARGYVKNALNKTTANVNLPVAVSDRQTTWNVQVAGSGGLFTLALAWNRVLSLLEYQQLFANPWQVFAAPRRRLLGAAAGVAAVFMPAAGGSALPNMTVTM